MMELFVQSAGVSKEYSWLKEPETRISDLPDEALKPMLKMVDSDYFSVVLYRPQERRTNLLLLVTALPSKKRIDNRTRKISNSVLWVGNNSDEATLRAIMIQALNGELANRVDQAVVSENNAQGFKVDFQQLKPEQFDSSSIKKNPSKDSTCKVGNLSELKSELIAELREHLLPDQSGILVVVSSTVSQSNFEQNKVWRGLSDEISDDEWIEVEDKGGNFRQDNFRQGSKSVNAPTPGSILPTTSGSSSREDTRNQEISTLMKKWIPIIVAFLIGLLVGVVGTQFWYNNFPNKQQETIEKNKETIKNQKNTIEGQGKTISDNQKTIDEKAATIKKEDKLIKDILDYNREFTQKVSPLIERSNELINGIQK